MADIRVKILVFKHDGTVVSQYLLGEGVHAIGRDPNSAIYAESEYISNEHAKLHLTEEGVFIEDLNSTSGTLLDNVTVRGKVRLNPGQRLQIGDLYIDLQLEGAGDLSPGAKIGAGRYQLVKELGRGAMGQVWLGQDIQLDEQVAIKVLGSDVANDAVSLLDLKREVQKSRKLSHDNIIRIHDLVQLPGENPFITLEYVEGTDLHVILLNQPDHIFQWSDVKPYVLQLCEALDYAHERKIVHRDLKPSNVMITQDGVLKLADFGIAASIADATGRSSMANVVSGTPQFMSPQQMLGKSPQASDDIYALGATIYNLLTGRPPFHTGDIVQQVHHVTPMPIEQRMAEFGLQNSVPDYVNSVVLSCLAKDPAARPASAGAIAEWIRTEGKSDIPAKPQKTETYVGEVMTAEPPAKDKKPIVLAIAAVAVIAVVLGVLFLGKSEGKNENQNQVNGAQPDGKGGVEGENQNQSNGSQSVGKNVAKGQPTIPAQTQAKLKEGLVAYYPFNGNANDESGNGNHGSVNSATLVADQGGAASAAYSFDGVDDYISINEIAFGSSDPWSVSIWSKASGPATGRAYNEEVGQFIGHTENNSHSSIAYFGANSHSIRFHTNIPPYNGLDWNGAYTYTIWNHHVISYNGTHVEVYQNGVSKGAQAVTKAFIISSLGRGHSPGVRPLFEGILDEVRIYNRSLSALETASLYEIEKSKPTTTTTSLKQGLVAYYPFNGNAKDESGRNNHGIVNGATMTTDRYESPNKAYYFDGTNDYIDAGDKADFDLGTKSATISLWLKSEGSTIPDRWMCGKSNGSAASSYWVGCGSYGVDSPYIGFGGVTGYRDLRTGSNITITDGKWHQMVATYDRTGYMVLYYDGVRLGASKISGFAGQNVENNGTFRIGHVPKVPSDYYFRGKLDDVAVYHRSLSAREVTALYNLEKP